MSDSTSVSRERGRACGTMSVHRRLLDQNPSYAAARAQIETAARQVQRRERLAFRSGITSIPVVVHVLHNGGPENVSDAQVQSQIVVLNQDFRRLNPDVTQVPAVWQAAAADARVEFVLATEDPAGNPTDGINRQQTSVTQFHSSTDDIKFTAQGGADAWPSDRYLNVWTGPVILTPSGQALLGYAQFPGGAPDTDGVVIAHDAFGTTGTAAAPFHLGRTATHEIGHWLDLYHIWGDDGQGCQGSDFVDDTPNHAGPNFGCPTFPSVTCGNGPNGDMFMNYMDYTDDACMFMFTAGQVLRMDATFAGPRNSFISAGVVAPIASSPTWTAAWSPGRLDIFGRGTDSAMYHKAWDGSHWVPTGESWEGLGGIFTSPPAVVAWGPGRLDVFGLGTDAALWHKAWDGSQWVPGGGDWERLGGTFTSPPAAVAWGPGRLDLFGLGTDSAMYHKAWDGSQWVPGSDGWERLGGIFISPPAVAAWGAGRLDVFGLGTDSGMWHKAWDGSQWVPAGEGWEDLGGIFTSPPTVAAWGAGRLDVFGLGTDRAVYHQAWDGSQWVPGGGSWEGLGGIFTSPPTVVAWGAGRLDLFGLGTDRAMWHKAWDGSQWVPGGGDWERIGGVFTLP